MTNPFLDRGGFNPFLMAISDDEELQPGGSGLAQQEVQPANQHRVKILDFLTSCRTTLPLVFTC